MDDSCENLLCVQDSQIVVTRPFYLSQQDFYKVYEMFTEALKTATTLYEDADLEFLVSVALEALPERVKELVLTPLSDVESLKAKTVKDSLYMFENPATFFTIQ